MVLLLHLAMRGLPRMQGELLDAVSAASAISSGKRRAAMKTAAIGALADVGQFEEAERVARSITGLGAGVMHWSRYRVRWPRMVSSRRLSE